jgi:outer membrane protein assembly factor BamB
MGDLFCLDAATGKVIWQKNVNKEYGFKLPTWHFSGSPLPMGDLLYFNLGTAGAAINKKTGALIWDNGKSECGYATPVPCTIDGQQCLVIFGMDLVTAVKPSDGKVLWQHDHETRYNVNASDPIIVGNSVFMSSGYNRGCTKITVTNGRVKEDYDSRVMRNHFNCSVFWKGHVYGFDESDLKCIDFKDSGEKWKEGSLGKGALMMSADGRMVIMSDKGELVIANADPKAFKAIARAQILPRTKCWTTPTLANGRIYARNANGDMVCVDVSGK